MKIMSPDLWIISNNMHVAFLTDFLIKKWRTSLMLMQIAHANFTVVFFLLIQLKLLLEMQMRNTSLPLHQMIFSRQHLHRLWRIARGKGVHE